MTNDIKVIIGVIIVTGLILLGGVYLFSSQKQTNQTQQADSAILVRPDSDQISSPSASVTLVEFADFQCPACGTYSPIIKRLETDFSKDLNIVFRNFPLNQHQNARIAAYAGQAAGVQGKFWDMHDKLFENQNDWSAEKDARAIFIKYAGGLQLDTDKFAKDIDSQVIKDRIERDITDGTTIGVNSTPTFYLNGEKLDNPGSYEDFQTLIKAAIIK